MGRNLASVVAAWLLVCPALAQVEFVGTITFDVKSGGQDALTIVEGTTAIPVEVYFSATTGGPDGPNNGVAAVYAELWGSAIAGVMQQPMTLERTFTDPYIPYVAVYGLGFDTLETGGTGVVGGISAFGGQQCAPPGPTYYDMWGTGTANAPHANGRPPVLFATGTLYLDPGLNDGDTAFVETSYSATAWGFDGQVADLHGINDILTVHVIPEPASLVMVGIGGLLLLRRGRW